MVLAFKPVLMHGPQEGLICNWMSGFVANQRINSATRAKSGLAVIDPIMNFRWTYK
jgi:hypothetical protein